MSVPTRAELNAEVDRQFHEQHPQAPAQLDPNDSSQASLADAPHGNGGTQAATNLLSVTADSGGYLLTLDGAIDGDAVGRWLWPNGVPAGVQLTARSATEF